MPVPQIVVLSMIALVILIFLVFSRERIADWQRVAEELGFAFKDVITKKDLHPARLDMKILSEARLPLSDAIVGQVGNTEVTVGDCTFITGAGGPHGGGSDVYTLCVVRNSSCHIPRCYCYKRPDSFASKLDVVFGGHTTAFPDDPEFSKYFIVEGHYDLFDENIRARFMKRRERGVYIEAKRDTLIYHYGKQCRPEIAVQMIQEALTILKLLSKSSRNRK
jgi:hypothetical protein